MHEILNRFRSDDESRLLKDALSGALPDELGPDEIAHLMIPGNKSDQSHLEWAIKSAIISGKLPAKAAPDSPIELILPGAKPLGLLVRGPGFRAHFHAKIFFFEENGGKATIHRDDFKEWLSNEQLWPLSSDVPLVNWFNEELDECNKDEAQQEGQREESSVPIFAFYRKGQHWMIGESGNEMILKHQEGYARLHFLIQNEGHEIDSMKVYHLGNTPEITSAFPRQELIDKKALKRAKLEIERLTQELANVVDPTDRSAIKQHIEAIEKYQKGKGYGFERENSKVRVNVTRSIRNAIKQIHQEVPSLQEFLNEKTVRTGNRCSYFAAIDNSIDWILCPPQE